MLLAPKDGNRIALTDKFRKAGQCRLQRVRGLTGDSSNAFLLKDLEKTGQCIQRTRGVIGHSFLQRLVLASRHGSKSVERAGERRHSGTYAITPRIETANPTIQSRLRVETQAAEKPECGAGSERRTSEARRIPRLGRRGRHGVERNARGRQRKSFWFRFQNLVWPAGRRWLGEEEQSQRGEESNPTGLGLPRARLGWQFTLRSKVANRPSALVRGEKSSPLALSPRALDRSRRVGEGCPLLGRGRSTSVCPLRHESRNGHLDGEKMACVNSRCQGKWKLTSLVRKISISHIFNLRCSNLSPNSKSNS